MVDHEQQVLEIDDAAQVQIAGTWETAGGRWARAPVPDDGLKITGPDQAIAIRIADDSRHAMRDELPDRTAAISAVTLVSTCKRGASATMSVRNSAP